MLVRLLVNHQTVSQSPDCLPINRLLVNHQTVSQSRDC